MRYARSLAVTTIAVMLTLAAAPRASAATSIRVDAKSPGRTFYGVGAISAGGGNSRFLIDYPEPARSAILDYLFKPNYGAALQMLKVEIGGDANATDGAEPSVEPTRGAIDCNAGYEFWLMEQAKARNRAIKLFALDWALPGWTGTPYSRRAIAYILHWLGCARRHGLTIDYMGGSRNEQRHYKKSWTVALRRALDAAGFSRIKLVMAEAWDPQARWAVADDLAADAAFRAVTDVVGDHDMCGHRTDGLRCISTRAARRLGKPLWATELGGMDGNAGAPAMARSMIRGYPQARLSAYLAWPMVSATPPGLPYDWSGLVTARQPWSGYYRVNAMTYAIAMVSWFTAPGWRYVNSASGGLGAGYADGGYTTLRAPDGGDWSTLVETTTAKTTQRVGFAIGGGLTADAVHVWRTKPRSRDPSDWMVQGADIHPTKRRFSVALRPGYVYAITTVVRGAKGAAASPPPRSFGSYVEQPQANPLGGIPMYLAPMDGAFQHVPCRDAPTLVCTQQMVPEPPVYWWHSRAFPYGVIGDDSLRDYTVSCEVLFTHTASSGGVVARFSHRQRHANAFRGYVLDLADTGRWNLLRNTTAPRVSVLASGTLKKPAGVGTWHTVALTVHGRRLTAAIDGRRVGSAVERSVGYGAGIAGIEAGGEAKHGIWTGTSWPVVQYRNLTITP
jgi:hypothetical protein